MLGVPAKKDSEQERGAQIDLVIYRGDHSINLCEMKFSIGAYVLSADYEQKVRQRIQLFKEKTKTRKALVSTFVTTYGVANGPCSSVVDNEVLADDLFE